MQSGLPLPLTAIQLLWPSLVTNGIQDVALASEGVEPEALQRKSRPADERIFNRRMVQQTLQSGLYMGSAAFVLFFALFEGLGMGEFESRSLVLLLMVLFENVYAFSCRSETRPGSVECLSVSTMSSSPSKRESSYACETRRVLSGPGPVGSAAALVISTRCGGGGGITRTCTGALFACRACHAG